MARIIAHGGIPPQAVFIIFFKIFSTQFRHCFYCVSLLESFIEITYERKTACGFGKMHVMKNVLKKIGICIVILIAIVIILGANFASDQLIQKVEDAHRVALSEKRYVKAVALGFVKWWLNGAHH